MSKLQEVSSGLLDRYKEKAKKSADELTAQGKHKQSTNRWGNIMKATGKQIEKTTANIKKSLKEAGDEVPFSGPYTKTADVVTDKSGAKHSPMSRVRHLARMAAKKQEKEKPVKEAVDQEAAKAQKETEKAALAAKQAREKQQLADKQARERESLKTEGLKPEHKMRPGWMLKADPELKAKIDANKKKYAEFKKLVGSKPEKTNEEVEQIDEISQKLAGDYYGAATKKHVEKVGVKPNMYDRIEKDMGKQRKAGVDRALDRVTGARKTNEETIVEGAYEKAEENKRSADAAKKQGDMFAHHLHMADHHDNMAEWHASKGRHGESDRHAEKSEKHHEEAMKLKESVELTEARINGREYASQGLMHPDHAKMPIHQVTGHHVDFYASKTGDKMQGKVVKNNGKEVHIQAHKDKELGDGKLHKFKVQGHLNHVHEEVVAEGNGAYMAAVAAMPAAAYVGAKLGAKLHDLSVKRAHKQIDASNAKRKATIAAKKVQKEEVELDESMVDSWKQVQSMDKGSITGGKEAVRKRLAYLKAKHNHHKKFGNDTRKVQAEIEHINRSHIAEASGQENLELEENIVQFTKKKSDAPREITKDDVENAWALKHIAKKDDKISYQHNGATIHHANGDHTFILGGHQPIFDRDPKGKLKFKDDLGPARRAFKMPTQKAKSGNVVSLKKEETTPYWKKPSFNKKMSRLAKQERLAREKKEQQAKETKSKEEC